MVADPATKAWLEAELHPVFGFPDLVRFSWQPVIRALEERGPKVVWWGFLSPPTDYVFPGIS